MSFKVYLFLADGFEEMDAFVPLDILRRADFEVETVSITDNLEVVGAHNLRVFCDTTIKFISPETANLLILPGGADGSMNLANSEKLGEILTKHNADEKWLAAICAAPYILGIRNLLKGKQATCYPGYEHFLTNNGGEFIKQSVVVSQNVITGNGAGAAIKFAFKIVEVFRGKRIADYIADKMQFEK